MELTKTEDEKIQETKVPMSETSKKIVEEIERSRAKERYQNYGEFLYNEGKENQKRQQLEQERLKRLEEAKEDVFSFKPQINTNFKVIRGSHAANSFKANVIAYAENEEKKCPFKPKINAKSSMIAMQKRNEEFLSEANPNPSITQAHESLFKDAEKRRIRIEHMQQEAARMSLPPSKGSKPSQEHIDKLVNSKKNVEKQISQLRVQLNSNFDPDTGREFFKPVINKRPKSAGGNRQTQNVYDELYQRQFDTTKSLISKEFYKEVNKLANKKHTNESSKKIAEVAKLKKIYKLFAYLDQDGDGFLNIEKDILSSSEERFNVLDKPLQEILLDVFELFDVDSDIGFEEFAAAVFERMEKPDSKSAILSSQKGSVHKVSGIDIPPSELPDSECSFKPKTNKKSEEIVVAKRASATDLHDLLYKEKDKREQNLSRLKQAYTEDEMRECSFKPQVINPSAEHGISDETLNRLLAPKKRQSYYGPSEDKELEECTFRPKTNTMPEGVYQQQTNNNNTSKIIRPNKSYSEIFTTEQPITPRKISSNNNPSSGNKSSGKNPLSLLR
ncbi:hypothetical protein NAEGRDRAFT_79231 [Naegleria gruberi]|uniref:EF-hand domain-containing protein n=1 Tax=Naegleria gruberi TaxID=5762 RepID=D2VAM2_NAEGR|nr:uncharacterized protein NAEGRDRAFT_79231 [Naegleria gruberi]EFC45978.1 hypothetical protein NAEGRDRAFT_79231 [Naegleria gruberi]|eukprot:XP_002678722.1 hypothetical protein NAEGRDRAFT_79231 [Naegleria gruberi strain NEG-M]